MLEVSCRMVSVVVLHVETWLAGVVRWWCGYAVAASLVVADVPSVVD